MTERIIKAQKSGNKKEIEQVNKEFEKLINKNQIIKKAISKFKEIGNQISMHNKKAELYFKKKLYVNAIEEYIKF